MKVVHQIIDDEHAVFFCHACDVGVAGSGVRVGVAEDCLDMPEAQALLKKMSGETMAKGVYGDFFLYRIQRQLFSWPAGLRPCPYGSSPS